MISDMYKAFYGLNDNAFSAAPNPHYFFLSERHREALAHLTYGLGESGGFILLTGDVGTGKTSVSRCLINQLPQNTDIAFILNPSLSDKDFFASLCDELKIPYNADSNAKQFTDSISQYLLENHKKKRKTLIVIDEAQHLNIQILEQLRLLTNLETDTDKLMQVVLIGQPELQLLLKRQELELLAQRISARYHLSPLNESETGLYIEHRLQVAGRFEPLFTKSAIKEVFTVTQGVPRLINLVCERALTAGYVKSLDPINKQMIRLSAEETLGMVVDKERTIWPLVIASCFIFAFAFMFFLMKDSGNSVNQFLPEIFKNKSNLFVETSKPKNEVPNNYNLVMSQFSDAINESRDLEQAYSILLDLWGKTPYKDMSVCQAAREQGLDCIQQPGNLKTFKNLDYPAVVYLTDDDDKKFYGAIISKNNNELLLQLGKQQFWVKSAWFEKHFIGFFDLIWHPDSELPEKIDPESSVSYLQWLDSGLAKLNNQPIRIVYRYDGNLKNKIELFQRQNGLRVDGVAGGETLQLLSAYLSQKGPRLSLGGNG